MFTIDEYVELKTKIRDLDLELFKVCAAFKYSYKMMNQEQQKSIRRLIDICNLSEETKTHIYDSRTTEAGKTEAEPNTETISR